MGIAPKPLATRHKSLATASDMRPQILTCEIDLGHDLGR